MLLRTRLMIALAILSVGAVGQLVLAQHLASLRNEQSASLAKPLAQFPERIGSWVGAELPADPTIIADIKIDDYLQRLYVHPTGERVVLWMSYSRKSSDQYHYPTVCMQGKGWQEDEAARDAFCAYAAANDDDGRAANVMRMYFTKNRQSQAVYYWYYLIGEDPVDRTMRRLGQTARAFLRGRRNASLTVEVFSQSPRPNRQLLDEFVALVAADLDGWMPAGTIVASDLGANY